MKKRTTGGRSSTKGTPSRSSRRSPAAEPGPAKTAPPAASPAAPPELARAQKKAAELVLEDESWRRGLTDAVASRLLDEALRRSDAVLAQAAQARRLTGDSAYAAADEARRMLMEGAGRTRGR